MWAKFILLFSLFPAFAQAKEMFDIKPKATYPGVLPSQLLPLSNGAKLTLKATMVNQTLNGKTYKRLAYNGMIPGPTLRVRQGDSIEVTLKNDTDVPTTLHSHGVRLDYRYDGVPGVAMQRPIAPGQSFTYTLTFPDPGIFWYHPHIREDYTQAMGLYGLFEVLPRDVDYYSKADSTRTLTLADWLLDKDGNQEPFFKNKTNFALMGRFGNVLLTNNDTDWKTTLKTGEIVRLTFINVASTRTFRLSIPGLKWKRLAADAGLFEEETWEDQLMVAPSERMTVAVRIAKAGEYAIQHTGGGDPVTIGVLKVVGPDVPEDAQYTALRKNPAVSTGFAKAKALAENAPDKELQLTMHMGGAMAGMHHGGDKPEKVEWEESMFAMNQEATSRDITWQFVEPKSKKTNMEIDWKFAKGTLAKIRLYNLADSSHPMQHPIHFHGNRFVVLARNGALQSNLAWKDSALLPTGETMDVVLENANAGEWMGHCHISEHLSSGMMFGFSVVNLPEKGR